MKEPEFLCCLEKAVLAELPSGAELIRWAITQIDNDNQLVVEGVYSL